MTQNNKAWVIKLVRSPAGRTRRQQDTVLGLGLKRLNQTVELPNTPEVRGMLNSIHFMLQVEPK